MPAGGARADAPSTPDASGWVTDGPVYALTRFGGRTYVGGDFDHVGPRTGSGVQISAATGAVSPPPGAFPEVAGGQVRAVVSDGAGGWYIGGDFTHVGGQPRGRLAHVEPGEGGALVVDPTWDPQANGSVRAMHAGSVPGKDDDVIYVAGDFETIDGSFQFARLAAIDRSTGVPDPFWTPAVDGPLTAMDVINIELEEGDPPAAEVYPAVFVAGSITKINGAARLRAGGIWGPGTGATRSGTTLAGWALPSPPTGAIRTMAFGPSRPALDGETKRVGAPLYLGGDFGVSGYKFDIAASGPSTGTAVQPAGLYSPTIQCSACTPSVHAVATSDDGGTLYVGGRFDKFETQERPNLAAIRGVVDIYAPGQQLVVRPWRPAPSGRVHALIVDAAQVYIGGDFTGALEAARPGLAAIAPSVSDEADDAKLEPWNPRATGGLADKSSGVVSALAASASGIFAGGSFTSMGALPRSNVAALDAAGAAVGDWNPSASAPVRAIAASGERVFLGGDFTQVGGVTRSRLAAVSVTDGRLDEGWTADLTGGAVSPQVLALALRDDKLYIGGAFTGVSGAPRANAAAVDAATAQLTDWTPNAEGHVHSLLATCGTVYAGGNFTAIGSQSRAALASLDPATGAATSWNPRPNSAVHTIARDEETLYIGGRFAKVGTIPRASLAAFNTTTGALTGWNPTSVGPAVRAIAVPPAGSLVYAGGTFTEIGGAARTNLAAVRRDTGQASSWNPIVDDSVFALTAEGDTAYVGGEFRKLGAQMQMGFGSFGVGSGQSASGPLTCTAPPPPQHPAAPAPVIEQRPADTPPPPPPPPPPPGPSFDTVAPLLEQFKLTRTRFRARRGTTLSYFLSEDANLTVLIERKRGRSWKYVGGFGYKGFAGQNVTRLKGRIRKKKLRPGRYRATAIARDARGNASKPVRIRFRIVR